MGRNKRHSSFLARLREKRRGRTRRVQRGGSQGGLLDHADAPAVTHGNVDFHVRFQPTVKADEFGPKFTTYQTAHEPYPVWTAPTPPMKYLIVCWDPDVKEGKSFLHWLVINCSSEISDGKVIASWYPPSPPPGTGEHRYIIGLMAQKGDLDLAEITDRTNFNPMTFAQTNSLSPIAYRGFRVETPPIFVPEGVQANQPAAAQPLPPA